MKVLVVDDDLELLDIVAFALRQAGYLVLRATDGPSALRVFESESPQLVILDHNLPGWSGLEILERLRARGHRTPVMMLTVLSAEEDQVRALDRGADDYLTKPFSPRTLLARVRALLRRSGDDAPAPLAAGELALDTEAQTIRVGGAAPVALTRLEFRLMQLLLTNAGHILPAERLTSHVWGYRDSSDRQSLKQLVHRLRQKIERDPGAPRYLLTVAGAGYLLEPSPRAADAEPSPIEG